MCTKWKFTNYIIMLSIKSTEKYSSTIVIQYNPTSWHLLSTTLAASFCWLQTWPICFSEHCSSNVFIFLIVCSHVILIDVSLTLKYAIIIFDDNLIPYQVNVPSLQTDIKLITSFLPQQLSHSFYDFNSFRVFY